MRQIFKRDSGFRKYDVSYSVTLNNLSGGDNGVVVMFPVPPNTAYQIVEKEPIFAFGYRKTADNKFDNQVVFWQTILRSGDIKSFAENIQITASPRKMEINSAWMISDYSRLKDNPECSLYLKDEPHINGGDERIKSLAESILSGETNLLLVVRKLYDYVVENLEYGNPIKGLYVYDYVLRNKVVDCGGFDVLLGSLCRACGIPSRIVSGFWAEEGESEAHKKMHAWLEVLLPNGEWFPLDPSIEHLRKRGRTKRKGGFGATNNDRIVFSYGSDISFKIGEREVFLDILQNPIVIAEGSDNSVEIKTNFSVQKMK